MAKNPFAELDDKGKRICVWFPYSPEAVAAVKGIPGARFCPPAKGGPFWHIPAEINAARILRRALPTMELGQRLKEWARSTVREERRLRDLATREDAAPLSNLPRLLPDLFEYCSGRPYQISDIRFMTECHNPLNANAPGMGKTFETMASVFESMTHEGPQLVLAPATALESVWLTALEKWQPYPVLCTSFGDRDRDAVYGEAMRLHQLGKPFWLVTNPYAAQAILEPELDKDTGEPVLDGNGKPKMRVAGLKCEAIQEIPWANLIVDEFHLCGLANTQSVTRKGLNHIKAFRRIATSGTPLGGKTEKLWAILNWLWPEYFPSKWRWYAEWLQVEEETITVRGGRQQKVAHVGEIKPGMEQAFYEAHARFMVRRKQNKDPQRIDVWCKMEKAQKVQYEEFEKFLMVQVEEGNITANNVLTEYMRLRQFASACQRLENKGNKAAPDAVDPNYPGTVENWVPYPTQDSCKLVQLERILLEHGIMAASKDDLSQEQALIFSASSRMANMVAGWLETKGVSVAVLDGSLKQSERAPLVRAFEERRGPRVICMTTTAGGVAITLNECESIHFLDETYNPDDQTQAEMRNRTMNAPCYYYRTRNTIDEWIMGLNKGKRGVNHTILDAFRKRAAHV